MRGGQPNLAGCCDAPMPAAFVQPGSKATRCAVFAPDQTAGLAPSIRWNRKHVRGVAAEPNGSGVQEAVTRYGVLPS